MKDIYISKDKKSSDDFDVVYLDDTACLLYTSDAADEL